MVPAAGRREPVIPFIGLAEALVLAGARRSWVPVRWIRPVLARLSQEWGLAHVLASRRLFTDGPDAVFEYAERGVGPGETRALRDLVVVRNGCCRFNDVIDSYRRHMTFGADGYAGMISLPQYSVAQLVVDPSRSFGQPIFARGGARLDDALAMFRAGESLQVVSAEYGIPLDHAEEAIRVATGRSTHGDSSVVPWADPAAE